MAASSLPAASGNVTSMGQLRPAGNSPFGPAATMGTSVIGTDLTIVGQNIAIISQNRLQIDGDVRGDVVGKQVTISREGSVIGTVSAEQIEVHGGVRGAIKAASVVVHPSAQVDADIIHQTVMIAEGAQVEGSLRKPRDASELVPNLDPASYGQGPRPVS